MTEKKKTVAEQLDAIVAEKAPSAAKHYAEKGMWPLPGGATQGPAHLRTAPYQVRTLKDGRKQVRLTCDDGDTLAGTGASTAEAVANLAAKIRL